MYLFNVRKPRAKAHFWNGTDTACRLWSTGGIDQQRPGWKVMDRSHGRLICHMCIAVRFPSFPKEPQVS
jgi:hypothetical protein